MQLHRGLSGSLIRPSLSSGGPRRSTWKCEKCGELVLLPEPTRFALFPPLGMVRVGEESAEDRSLSQNDGRVGSQLCVRAHAASVPVSTREQHLQRLRDCVQCAAHRPCQQLMGLLEQFLLIRTHSLENGSVIKGNGSVLLCTQ